MPVAVKTDRIMRKEMTVMKKIEVNTVVKLVGWALVGAGTLVKAFASEKDDKTTEEMVEKIIDKKLGNR